MTYSTMITKHNEKLKFYKTLACSIHKYLQSIYIDKLVDFELESSIIPILIHVRFKSATTNDRFGRCLKVVFNDGAWESHNEYKEVWEWCSLKISISVFCTDVFESGTGVKGTILDIADPQYLSKMCDAINMITERRRLAFYNFGVEV